MKEEEKRSEKESLMEMLAKWKKSAEEEWGHVQEEWRKEHEQLNKARVFKNRKQS